MTRLPEPARTTDAFCAALAETTRALCRMIAADGEGASKLLECKVSGAADVKTAKTVAKSVICSSLLKAAMFGADANWGACSAQSATAEPMSMCRRSAFRLSPQGKDRGLPRRFRGRFLGGKGEGDTS